MREFIRRSSIFSWLGTALIWAPIILAVVLGIVVADQHRTNAYLDQRIVDLEERAETTMRRHIEELLELEALLTPETRALYREQNYREAFWQAEANMAAWARYYFSDADDRIYESPRP